MGGARIDKNALKLFLLSQTNTFTPDDISKRSNGKYSTATAYVMIKELVGSGNIIMDHKDGGRMYYAVAGGKSFNKGDNANPAALVQNIMSLSVADRFSCIHDLTEMVVEGISPSIMITGIAGIGKTHLVKSRLKAMGKVEGEDFHFISGHSAPMGLYRFLYEHQDSTIVFDDCDSIFETETSVNILKSALDSYDVRRVCWMSGRMPEDLEPQFDFEGQVIFISNLNASKIDEAVKSRTVVIDLQMSRKEICDHLQNLIKDIEPKMDLDKKEEVLDYMRERMDYFEQLNIRTFIKACRIRCFAERKDTDWKKTILVLS